MLPPIPNLRVDVHGHLLPAVDDGSRHVPESVEIAKRLVTAGYGHFVCTPHIWPGTHEHRPEQVVARVDDLQRHLDAAGVPLKLIAGGEINLDMPLESMSDEEIPTYGMRGTHALFDFWDDELPAEFWRKVKRLQRSGVTPVLAHPERVAAFQFNPELLDEVRAAGLLVQGNLGPLADPPHLITRKSGERFLRDGKYDLLGTDTHQLDTLDVRLRGLERARQLVGDAALDRLTRVVPARVALGVEPAI